jgi:Icc-related predicted phosphoesterase
MIDIGIYRIVKWSISHTRVRNLKILSVSDDIDPKIYNDSLKKRLGDVDLVISCGDLSYMYLEYIISVLNCPLVFVHGNHDKVEEINNGESRSYPFWAENLHRRFIRKKGLLIAGVEGSIQYSRRTPYQYSQRRMWSHVFSLIPSLLYNRLVYGRYIDIFVSHAPPRGVHEGKDWVHQGINAFRWLINTFKPRYHFHGHIHYYRPDEITETLLGDTMVINTYRSRITEMEL